MCIYLDSKYHQKKDFSIYAYLDQGLLRQLYQQLDQIAEVGWFSFAVGFCLGIFMWQCNYHLNTDHSK